MTTVAAPQTAQQQQGADRKKKAAKPNQRQLAGLKPSWARQYQLTGRADLERQPNLVYLNDRQRNQSIADPDLLTEQLETLFDPGQAAEWRTRYQSMSFQYERRRQAGLSTPADDAAYIHAVGSMRGDIEQKTKNYQLKQSEGTAIRVVRRNPYVKPLAAPGVILAGFYIGKPVNLRLSSESRFTFRTSIRDRLGQIELHSPFIYWLFEVHPQASQQYTLLGNPAVDFGKAMNFDHVVDFESERYQLKVARHLPFVDLNSFVLYGSSSNTLTGSISKQLTPSISAAVDSVYYLTPYAADRSMEERVRLKYSISF
jgi:hypothetical protein